MTFLIVATLSASIVYFAIAFIATMHDHLMSRFSKYSYMNNLPEPEIDYAEIITELEKEMQIFEAKLLPVAIAHELPDSIRGLRDYVRSENLQDAIKQLTGRSVSSLKKDELHHAVKLAIA